MRNSVHVIGAARTDFRRNLRKEGKTLRHLIREAGSAAIADAGIGPEIIGAGIVGNFAAGLFTRQLHLGAFLTEIDPALRGIPTMHVEAACASGSVAVLSAAQAVLGGVHDVVLVVGAEQQKTMPPAEGADVLGAAADYLVEKGQYGDFMFPKLFARIAGIYMARYGITERQLAAVAVKNFAHARLNPLAQMRDAGVSLEQACAACEANPVIAPPLKASDCSQITDGAAALILCSGSFLRRILRASPERARRSIRLLGYGHTTDHLPLEEKEVPGFPLARKAADEAYAMAGLTPPELDGAEVHDCFSISEIVQYETLGFAPPGEGMRWFESGATTLPQLRGSLFATRHPPPDFSLPVNPGGGLIGDGHPVGATGVRQVVEAFDQLTGRAGARAIPGARRFLTSNVGGSVTTSVVMIWERDD